MTLFQAAILGVVQGLTEFLPVSSSAHLILARAVFGWNAGELNLAFDVAYHLGTLVAVAAFFGGDIASLFRNIPSALSRRPTPDGRRLWLLAAAMLPVMIVGLTMSDFIDAVRDQPRVTAIALIAGAFLLFLVERLSPREGTEATLTMPGAVVIGAAQAMALVPGVSRSGATITAGMLLGMSRLASARFTFLLSVPAIGAAAVHEGLKLRHAVLGGHDWALFAVGFGTSAVVGYLTVGFLLKFLVSHRLDVFAWYRIAIGVAILIWLS
ncbi:MAG TPA: undecaprenyl-diphosphatase UppP [Vicinamibacterales bacterium]|nr:undecaprenyl-diphosphatase UppP [Vicinamibacterales bacterium]